VSEWMEDVTRVHVDQARALEDTLKSRVPRQVVAVGVVSLSTCTDAVNGHSSGSSGRPCGAEGHSYFLIACIWIA
jgi:hypothetical protein